MHSIKDKMVNKGLKQRYRTHYWQAKGMYLLFYQEEEKLL